MIIKVRESVLGQNYNAVMYPETGVYYDASMNALYLVNKETNAVQYVAGAKSFISPSVSKSDSIVQEITGEIIHVDALIRIIEKVENLICTTPKREVRKSDMEVTNEQSN